jgi:hypothetical protein
LQKMDVPAIHLLIGNSDDAKHDSPTLKEAVEAFRYLSLVAWSLMAAVWPHSIFEPPLRK